MEAKKGGNSPAGDGYVPQQPVQHDRKPEDDIARPVPPKGPPGDTEVEMEEIPIAGRTKMQVPKPKAKSDPAKQQEQGGAEEHSDAKTELNSILKRSPGMSSPIQPSEVALTVVAQSLSSPNLFARIVHGQSPFWSTNTLFYQHRMWLNSINIRSEETYRVSWERVPDVVRFPTSWSMEKVSEGGMIWRSWTRREKWHRR